MAEVTPVRLWQRLAEGISWRWRHRVVPAFKRFCSLRDIQWARVVSDRNGEAFARSLEHRSLDTLEISADNDRWKNFGFGSYTTTTYPAYDFCAGPLGVEAFDRVIAEPVMEHLQWPGRAVHHAWQMLRPGGWFLVTTPFLLRVHAYPDDFSRWTEQGLKHLLIEGGFLGTDIRTGSWGNRACVKANFASFPWWLPWWHSLHNEPLFPVVVWAYAQKQSEAASVGTVGLASPSPRLPPQPLGREP